MLQRAFRGQKKQALGIIVEATGRVDTRDSQIVRQVALGESPPETPSSVNWLKTWKGLLKSTSSAMRCCIPGITMCLWTAGYCKEGQWQSEVDIAHQGMILKSKKG